MKAFIDKDALKNNVKPALMEGLLPFGIQFLILAAVILEFVFIIANPVFPNVNGVPQRSDEANNPNIMRLVYMLVAIPVTVGLVIWSLKAKSTKKTFWIALVAGIVAWQCVGECSWHFGLPVGESFVFFPKIEGVQGTFVLLVFFPITLYSIKKGTLEWGLKVFILSFFCNWIGHWLILGPAGWLPQSFTESWEKIAGYVFGLGGCMFLLYRLFFKAKTTEERLIISLLLYTAVGMLVEGAFGIGGSLE